MNGSATTPGPGAPAAPAGPAAGGRVAAVDVSFELAGRQVPADYALPLARAVSGVLPWFDAEPRAGIHPLRAAASTHGMLVLARRAKLVLRVPASHAVTCLALCGAALDVAGEAVTVNAAVEHALMPSATLYAHRVVTGAGDERAFHDDVLRWRDEIGVRCEFISGRARRIAGEGGEVLGYGLALHGLSPSDSLVVQSEGMGTLRRLGCGIFIPHKAIATAD
jgi:CRISPR-associated protein Cas6